VESLVADGIFHVAVHELERADTGFRVKFGQEQLAITPTIDRVTAQLFDLYKRRASKSHGKFSTAADVAPTQKHLEDYVATKGAGFPDFISRLMETLRVHASSQNAASGGFVFFAHLERDERQFLLVAVVSNKLGATLTKTYDVKDAEHLDIEGFRFAGRISLTGWAAKEDRYISFLKGKGEVSDYFKTFLGCDTTVQDRQDTNDLVEALKAFADAQNMKPPEREGFLSKAKDFCDQIAREKQPLAFETLSNAVVPDDPEPLLSFLVDPDRGLNDGFVPHRSALGSLVKLKRETPYWSVAFERSAIHQGKVDYDPKQNVLILKDLPEDFAAELRHEILDV